VYIALALVLLQQPEGRVEGLRKRLAKAVGDKHEETMARMGASVATGGDGQGGVPGGLASCGAGAAPGSPQSRLLDVVGWLRLGPYPS
jgi:hypothetical protein